MPAQAVLADAVSRHLAPVDAVPAAFRGFRRHAGKIGLDIVHASALFTHEMHVIGADVFVYRAFLPEGEPANQPHFRQVIQRAVDGRRSDTFQTKVNSIALAAVVAEGLKKNK